MTQEALYSKPWDAPLVLDAGGAVGNVLHRKFNVDRAQPDGTINFGPMFQALENELDSGVAPKGTYRFPASQSLTKHWRFERGAMLKPDAGVTLTLSGGFSAGLYQIFDLSAGGTVRARGMAPIYPQWWGAKGDGLNDDTEALQAAFNSGGWVFLPPGIYRTTKELTLPNNIRVVGSGNPWSVASGRSDVCIRYEGPLNSTIAVMRVSATVIGLEPTAERSNVKLEGFTLDANNLAGHGLYCAYLTNDSTIEDITAMKATQHGIQLEKVWYARVTGLLARNCLGCGITVGRFDWGGVNGVSFRNLRGHFCGLDKAFDKASHYEWGYGVGLYLGHSCTVENVVAEQNDGAGLLVSMANRTTCNIRGVYMEGNMKAALTEGRSTRTYGLVVKGAAGSRAYSLESIYLHGEIGQASAQGIWLTGTAPTNVGALALRDVAYGEFLDADWNNYVLEGYVYPGLTGNRASQRPANYYRVLFQQHGVNLRFTSSVNDCLGVVDNLGGDTAIFFIPSATVNLATAPGARLQDAFDGTIHYSHVFPLQMTQGQIYTSLFNSGSLGSQKVGKVVATTTANIDCFGTIGVLVRRQRGADYEL